MAEKEKTIYSLVNVKSSGLGKLGKPLTALVQALRAAFGKAYEPTGIRREAKAKAEAALIYAKAEEDITDLREPSRKVRRYRTKAIAGYTYEVCCVTRRT